MNDNLSQKNWCKSFCCSSHLHQLVCILGLGPVLWAIFTLSLFSFDWFQASLIHPSADDILSQILVEDFRNSQNLIPGELIDTTIVDNKLIAKKSTQIVAVNAESVDLGRAGQISSADITAPGFIGLEGSNDGVNYTRIPGPDGFYATIDRATNVDLTNDMDEKSTIVIDSNNVKIPLSTVLSNTKPAYTFDGTSGYVEVSRPNDLNFGMQNFSIQGFFQSSTIANWKALFDHRVNNSVGITIDQRSDGKLGVALDDGVNLLVLNSGEVIVDGYFHEYLVSINRDTQIAELYIDKVLKNSVSISTLGSFDIIDTPALIGGRSIDSNKFWNGTIAGTYIYDGAASYDAHGNLVNVENTRVAYHFEETTGSTAYDASGNGNHGTIVGGVTHTSLVIPPNLSITNHASSDGYNDGKNDTTYSNDFTQGNWKIDRLDLTPNAGIAPDGSNTAIKVDVNALGLGSTRVKQTNLTINDSFRVSIYAKLGDSTEDFIRLSLFNSTDGVYAGANFDIRNGIVSGGNETSIPSIKPVGNGWYKCSLIGTPPTTKTGNSVFIFPNQNPGNNPPLGDLGKGHYLWGAQFEYMAHENVSAAAYAFTTDGTVNGVVIPADSSRPTYDIFGEALQHLPVTEYSTESIYPYLTDSLVSETEAIVSATLQTTAVIPTATSIDYFLSNDGGVTWESVTSGSEHTFMSMGSDLRVKAELSTTDKSKTPLISALSIDYTVRDSVNDSSGWQVQNSGETISINDSNHYRYVRTTNETEPGMSIESVSIYRVPESVVQTFGPFYAKSFESVVFYAQNETMENRIFLRVLDQTKQLITDQLVTGNSDGIDSGIRRDLRQVDQPIYLEFTLLSLNSDGSTPALDSIELRYKIDIQQIINPYGDGSGSSFNAKTYSGSKRGATNEIDAATAELIHSSAELYTDYLKTLNANLEGGKVLRYVNRNDEIVHNGYRSGRIKPTDYNIVQSQNLIYRGSKDQHQSTLAMSDQNTGGGDSSADQMAHVKSFLASDKISLEEVLGVTLGENDVEVSSTEGVRIDGGRIAFGVQKPKTTIKIDQSKKPENVRLGTSGIYDYTAAEMQENMKEKREEVADYNQKFARTRSEKSFELAKARTTSRMKSPEQKLEVIKLRVNGYSIPMDVWLDN